MAVFWVHHQCDAGSKDLWNVGKVLPDYTALQPRRQPSSYSSPWEPQILLFVNRFSVIKHGVIPPNSEQNGAGLIEKVGWTAQASCPTRDAFLSTETYWTEMRSARKMWGARLGWRRHLTRHYKRQKKHDSVKAGPAQRRLLSNTCSVRLRSLVRKLLAVLYKVWQLNNWTEVSCTANGKTGELECIRSRDYMTQQGLYVNYGDKNL
jgi:hypothetical protein